jgi:hypothetical protein
LHPNASELAARHALTAMKQRVVVVLLLGWFVGLWVGQLSLAVGKTAPSQHHKN